MGFNIIKCSSHPSDTEYWQLLSDKISLLLLQIVVKVVVGVKAAAAVVVVVVVVVVVGVGFTLVASVSGI